MSSRSMARSRGNKRSLGNIINSLKNSATVTSSTSTTVANKGIAKAVDDPLTVNNTDVKNGCVIKAIWLSIDFCGLSSTGALQMTGVYLFKNAGANLTAPNPLTVGNSNEKRFVIREWSQMTMRNQDGNPPYHWEGWVKIPRSMQRMATDDIWQIIFATDVSVGHIGIKFVYKYYF